MRFKCRIAHHMGRLSAAALLGASALLLAAATACSSTGSAPSTPSPTATPAVNSSPTIPPAAQPTSPALPTSTFSVIGVPGDGGKAAGVAIAHAYLSASDTPAFEVDGTNISARDFAVEVQIVKNNVAVMQQHVAPGDPSATGTLARLQLIQGAGVESVALAGLIQREVLYHEAASLGLIPIASDVAAYVEQMRSVIDQPSMAGAKAVANLLGNQYWTEYLPHDAWYALAEQNLRKEKLKGITNQGKAQTAWTRLERDAVNAATVEILDRSAMGDTSVSAAKAYLARYEQFVAGQ